VIHASLWCKISCILQWFLLLSSVTINAMNTVQFRKWGTIFLGHHIAFSKERIIT
jgi:hypothetical protein